MDYISIVPVRVDSRVPVRVDEYAGTAFLFKTKAWTTIKKGDIVEVEGKNGNYYGEVISDPITLKPDDEKYRFILEITDTKEPLNRITGKFAPITYEEGDE